MNPGNNASQSYNCTFMELKFMPNEFMKRKTVVIIVPLWN